MRKSTKIVSTIMAMAMLFSISGCGSSKDNGAGAGLPTEDNPYTSEVGGIDDPNIPIDPGADIAVDPTTGVKNEAGLYEYMVAGKYKVTCRTNISEYIFSMEMNDGIVYQFIDMQKLSSDLGYEIAGTTPDASKATAFRRYENGEKVFGILVEYQNGDYFESLSCDVYGDDSRGHGYEIKFVDDKHDNNYWVGAPDFNNCLVRSLSMDQIVLLTKGMEESIDGNHSDDWLYEAGFTKPDGNDNFHIYYNN